MRNGLLKGIAKHLRKDIGEAQESKKVKRREISASNEGIRRDKATIKQIARKKHG